MKAAAKAGAAGTDIVLTPQDAGTIAQIAQASDVLTQCRVVILVERPEQD